MAHLVCRRSICCLLWL